MAEITIASPQDRARLIHTLVLGFAADPVARWASPTVAEYLNRREEFFDAFGGAAFDHGTAFVANGGEALALWLPPGVEPDGERLFAIAEATTPPARFEEQGGFFAQMDDFHPKEPHWYLPLIAVDPVHQGKGLGTALMQAALARVDEDRLPAYLESSALGNVPFYEHLGFEKMGEIQSGSSPVMTPMLRPARG